MQEGREDQAASSEKILLRGGPLERACHTVKSDGHPTDPEPSDDRDARPRG